jgi:hypothetical protein
VVRGERDGKRVMFHLCLDEPEVRALVAWAISGRVVEPGNSAYSPVRRPGGADLHFEGPRPHGPASGPRTAVGAGRRRPPPRLPRSRPADPAGVGGDVEGADSDPPLEQPAARPPAPQRPPRHDLEDFLL